MPEGEQLCPTCGMIGLEISTGVMDLDYPAHEQRHYFCYGCNEGFNPFFVESKTFDDIKKEEWCELNSVDIETIL